MRAKTLPELISLFKPEHHLDHTEHHFFVNIFGNELNIFANEIAYSSENKTFFITGQSGNGKTSMLRNLQAQYPILLGEKFHFLYLEGRDLLNLKEGFDIRDVMLRIAHSLIPNHTLTKVSIDVESLNQIIEHYEREVLAGEKRLVLVIDDFEKIVVADVTQKDDVMYQFLFRDIPSLSHLQCIKLITFPFHFRNQAMIEDASFRDFIVHIDSNGFINSHKLQEVILKRLDTPSLIDDMPFLLSSSGANMRQLIQMVHDAGIISNASKGTKIDKDDIKNVVAKLRKEFSTLVESNIEFYHHINKHNSIDFENATHSKLLNLALRSRTVFAYLYEERYYYAVNPVVLGILEGRGKPRFF